MGVSHVRYPVGAIFWCESAAYEQDNVDNPPDANTSKREQLAHSGSSLAEAETVNAQKAEEDAVQQRCHEVMTRVPTKEGIELEDLCCASRKSST